MLLLQWRGKTRQLADDAEERKHFLLNEKHNMQGHYQQLKLRIKAYRTTQQDRLVLLSNCALECKKKMQVKLDVGRALLAIGDLTKEYVPVPANPSLALTTMTERMRLTSTPTSPSPEDQLDGFYGRYNALLDETLAAEREMERLERENSELRSLLDQYHSACSLQADSLDGRNTLLIVNGKTNINQELGQSNSNGGRQQQQQQQQQQLTVQEAPFMPSIALTLRGAASSGRRRG